MRLSYGGIFENGSREYTLDDFYSLHLDKLDRYVPLKRSDVVIPTDPGESSSDEDDEDDSEDDDSEYEDGDTPVARSTAGSPTKGIEYDDDHFEEAEAFKIVIEKELLEKV